MIKINTGEPSVIELSDEQPDDDQKHTTSTFQGSQVIGGDAPN